MAWGTAEDIAERVREHLDGGADHVLLQPLGDLNEAVRQLELLSRVGCTYSIACLTSTDASGIV